MSNSASKETIAQRIERGKAQNSTEDGAIVPFPDGADFHDPLSMMKSYDRTWLVGHQNKGAQLTSYVYASSDGLPIFVVLRIDHPDQGKDIRPLRCERLIGVCAEASMKHLEGQRPLYNLDQIAVRSDDPVLLVEGEKTADAAQARFPSFVATTWPGGAQSAGKVDLSPLANRHVTIWPDNDVEGRKAANRLAAELVRIAVASCRIVQVPTNFPEKWDLGDA